MDVRRQTESDYPVIISYLMATAKKQGMPFITILKEYKNRPFDDKNAVLKKMPLLEAERFEVLWQSQVNAVREFENSIDITFPLKKESLPAILNSLKAKLEEMLNPIRQLLHKELSKNGVFDHSSAGSDNAMDAIKLVNTVLLSYVFHLLTDAQSVKEKANPTRDEINRCKQYQEFHRILRKSLLSNDLIDAFETNLLKLLEDKSNFNEAKFLLYQSIFGEMAEDKFRSALVLTAHDFLGTELLALKNSVVPLIQSDDIKKDFNIFIWTYWFGAWDKEISKYNSVDQSGNLFSLLSNADLETDIKKRVLLSLCQLAVSGSFQVTSSKKEPKTYLNDQCTFIQKILEAAAAADLQPQAEDFLRDNFANTKNSEIQKTLNIKPSTSGSSIARLNPLRFFSGSTNLSTAVTSVPVSQGVVQRK